MGFFSRSRNGPPSASETNGHSNGSVDQGSELSPNSVRPKKEKKKKDKDKDKEAQTHSRNGSPEQKSFEDERVEERFLPLTLERPAAYLADKDNDQGVGYGYLSFENHVVLGLEQVTRLVDVVCGELSSRGGLDTPFIFTTKAMDIKASAVKRLIKAFLGTCVVLVGREKDFAEQRWREEASFAGMHELGMCLRWGLARVARIYDGAECRGLLNWDYYLQWAQQEQALGYPPDHFRDFLPNLQAPLRLILLTVLSLLAQLTAHSATSGHTPPTLSPLFGPLFFGLGPPGLPFHHTYNFYLLSVSAMEHILLAFIRWQNTPDATGQYSNILTNGTASTLGVPPRLKEWIKGYPAMLNKNSNYKISNGFLASNLEAAALLNPRKGARKIRITNVQRNVRTYERDLVKTAASWGERQPSSTGGSNGRITPSVSTGGGSGSTLNGFASSYEWLRISPPVEAGHDEGSSSRMPPRYSDTFRKRLNLPASATPETGFSHSSTHTQGLTQPPVDFTSPLPSAFTTRTSFTLSDSSSRDGSDFFSSNTRLGAGPREYKSLTDEKWNNFEDIGFGGMGVDESAQKKLQFDLTESARATRTIKRETLDWTSFSSSGFSRTDAPLRTMLQLSIPTHLTLNNYSSNTSSSNASSASSPNSSPPMTPVVEGIRKLRKKVKNGVAGPTHIIPLNTEPVLGQEQIIEETFVDVFCDLLRGSGWNQSLGTGFYGPGYREDGKYCSNWALVSFF
ncbi:hypothetical protein GYMLUDRAFT_343141 [Collybiopsis luxurians FD-317 M1]|nr:hypothetical protein GYMLUDRAFT_343141 [Collybiopsis luxurians FD-317 M1]